MGLTQKLGTIPLAIQTDSSNNVGIGGAANASYKLAVTGAGLYTGNLNINGETLTIGGTTNNAIINNIASVRVNIDCDNTGTGESFTIGHNQTAINDSNVLFRVQDNGNVGIGTSSVTDFGSSYTVLDVYNGTVGGYLLARSPNVTGQISVDNNTAMYVQSRTNHPIVFAPNNSEKMRLTTAGNLGIGTNAPDRLLQISNTSGQAVFSVIAATNDSADIFFGDTDNKAEAVIRFVNGTNYLGFLNGGSERMRITSSGNVGIGTTSPGSLLTVNGTTQSSFYKSSSGNTGSATSGTTYGIINVTTRGVYYIYAQLPAGIGNSSLYSAFIQVLTDGSSARIINSNNGSSLTLSLSGTLVSVAQSSGATQGAGIDWSFICQPYA